MAVHLNDQEAIAPEREPEPVNRGAVVALAELATRWERRARRAERALRARNIRWYLVGWALGTGFGMSVARLFWS